MHERPEHRLQRLINTKLSGDKERAAALVTEVRHKRTSIRTLQAWLAPQGQVSKRTCPEQVVDLLELRLSDAQDPTRQGSAKSGSMDSWATLPLSELTDRLALMDAERRRVETKLDQLLKAIEIAEDLSDLQTHVRAIQP